MKKQINQVKEFSDKFKVSINKKPSLLKESDYELRFKLMEEENEEYFDACAEDDVVGIADALGDQLYILLGTILKHGMQHKVEEVFDEIHSSNMSKLDENGEPIFRKDGKILKGKNYFKPNLENILN